MQKSYLTVSIIILAKYVSYLIPLLQCTVGERFPSHRSHFILVTQHMPLLYNTSAYTFQKGMWGILKALCKVCNLFKLCCKNVKYNL